MKKSVCTEKVGLLIRTLLETNIHVKRPLIRTNIRVTKVRQENGRRAGIKLIGPDSDDLLQRRCTAK